MRGAKLHIPPFWGCRWRHFLLFADPEYLSLPTCELHSGLKIRIVFSRVELFCAQPALYHNLSFLPLEIRFADRVINIITKLLALWLHNQLWFIVPVNPWTIAHLLNYFIKAIMDHKFLCFRGIINHLGCWTNTRRRKSLACDSWFTPNSSRVLPTLRVV